MLRSETRVRRLSLSPNNAPEIAPALSVFWGCYHQILRFKASGVSMYKNDARSLISAHNYSRIRYENKKHSQQIAGIAAKESTCVPHNRDRNRYRHKLKKLSTPLKKLCKKIQIYINQAC